MSTLSPEALLTNKSLTFLDLTNNGIGNDGASELAKAIEQMPMWPHVHMGWRGVCQSFDCVANV